MNRRVVRVLLCSVLIVLCTQAYARTVAVPGDYATLGAALFFGLPNDSILVSPGTYEENLEWPLYRPGITLLGTAGPDVTIIDGGGDDTVIGIYTSVDSTTVIRGFTIRNGYAAGA